MFLFHLACVAYWLLLTPSICIFVSLVKLHFQIFSVHRKTLSLSLLKAELFSRTNALSMISSCSLLDRIHIPGAAPAFQLHRNSWQVFTHFPSTILKARKANGTTQSTATVFWNIDLLFVIELNKYRIDTTAIRRYVLSVGYITL